MLLFNVLKHRKIKFPIRLSSSVKWISFYIILHDKLSKYMYANKNLFIYAVDSTPSIQTAADHNFIFFLNRKRVVKIKQTKLYWFVISWSRHMITLSIRHSCFFIVCYQHIIVNYRV